MPVRRGSRSTWALCIAAIIAAGILSRLLRTGLPIFDKYLGDALYAAMVYALLRLLATPPASALAAIILMTAIEFFQLTMIPARMLASQHLITRLCARLLGVQFSVPDLLAYAVGICIVFLADAALTRHRDS